MKKRIFVGSLIACVLLFGETVSLDFFMEQLDTVIYVVLSLFLPALILFSVNLGINWHVGDNPKVTLFSAILLTIICVAVTFLYGMTGSKTISDPTSDTVKIVSEDNNDTSISESYKVDENTDVQIIYSNDSGSGQIYIFALCFIAAAAGGFMGNRNKRSDC